jgi:hypothetical protein
MGAAYRQVHVVGGQNGRHGYLFRRGDAVLSPLPIFLAVPAIPMPGIAPKH